MVASSQSSRNDDEAFSLWEKERRTVVKQVYNCAQPVPKISKACLSEFAMHKLNEKGLLAFLRTEGRRSSALEVEASKQS
jgi:hypothetical protein